MGPSSRREMQPGSKLIVVQSAGGHPGQLSAEELDLVRQWIAAGALEK